LIFDKSYRSFLLFLSVYTYINTIQCSYFRMHRINIIFINYYQLRFKIYFCIRRIIMDHYGIYCIIKQYNLCVASTYTIKSALTKTFFISLMISNISFLYFILFFMTVVWLFVYTLRDTRCKILKVVKKQYFQVLFICYLYHWL